MKEFEVDPFIPEEQNDSNEPNPFIPDLENLEDVIVEEYTPTELYDVNNDEHLAEGLRLYKVMTEALTLARSLLKDSDKVPLPNDKYNGYIEDFISLEITIDKPKNFNLNNSVLTNLILSETVLVPHPILESSEEDAYELEIPITVDKQITDNINKDLKHQPEMSYIQSTAIQITPSGNIYKLVCDGTLNVPEWFPKDVYLNDLEVIGEGVMQICDSLGMKKNGKDISEETS